MSWLSWFGYSAPSNVADAGSPSTGRISSPLLGSSMSDAEFSAYVSQFPVDVQLRMWHDRLDGNHLVIVGDVSGEPGFGAFGSGDYGLDSWFDIDWKDILEYVVYTWSGYSTGKAVSTVLTTGIPALGPDQLPIWEGLGSGRVGTYVHFAAGSVGYGFSMDYMGDDDNEMAWWGGFGSALFWTGYDMYQNLPTIGQELLDAGRSILDYPIFGDPTSDAFITVEYNPSWWEDLTGRPFFDDPSTDWDFFMDIHN